MVKMIDVASSNVEQIGYDKRESRLFVRYQDGGKLYVYFKVPPVIWSGLLHARSKGTYIAQEIKGYFEYQLADDEDVEAA